MSGFQESFGVPTARQVAGGVLLRILSDGAWASRALDAELSRARMIGSESARATDLVYGTLRAHRDLDARIATACDKGPPTDLAAITALRMATYELVHTPESSHAIVDGWVQFTKDERGEGLSRFVNAVLRRLSRDRPETPLPRKASVPSWIEKLALRSLGEARASALLTSLAETPPLALRARNAADRDALLAAIAEARPDAEVWAGTLSPLAVLVRGAGDPRKLPGYREGRFSVQDEGSQLIAAAVGAQPGERVIDACAGRGGKTMALAEAVGATGRVVAIDIAEPKLERLSDELKRLTIEDERIERHAIDLSVGLGGLPEASFDRVLIDAPCSGLGTLGRRPELSLRLTYEDPQRLATLQSAILQNAVRLLKPGGRLVYAVCSIANIEIAAARELTLTPADPALAVAVDPDGVLRIGPWNVGHTMDAYQVVVRTR